MKEIEIIPLSEGSFTVDKSKQFVPFDKTIHRLNDRPVGSLLVEIQPFVLITAKDTLLIDTGLGFQNEQGLLQIHQNLADKGIDPVKITKVLLSHLHKDHAGGVSMHSAGNNSLAFQNATYYVNRDEFNYAKSHAGSSYIEDEINPLENAANVVFTSGNGTIDGYIHYEVTGGHSPFHQVFKIIQEENIIFFGADVAPQLQQMKNRFVAKYDYDGEKSMKLRQQWWQQGKAEKWKFLFYHDIKTPVATP